MFIDADFGSELDRKSSSRFCIKVFGNTVAWTSKKQTTLTLSSTEADYIILATVSADLMQLKNVLADSEISSDNSPKIYKYNQSCIHLLSRWEYKRLKHVDVKYNFVRDLHEKRLIAIEYVS